MSNLYEISDLSFNYQWNNQDVNVLKGLNLELPNQCFACLVGPSGTGKTTLLNILGLVENNQKGKIEFNGKDVSNISEREKQKLRLETIGFVFQSFYLIPTLSAMENASYFLRRLGQSKKVANEKASQVLELLGLQDHLNKYPKELSGGQRQRVAIARAIAKKPKVLLADEPTANLDTETALSTITAFKKLQKADGTSFIFSTHDSRLVDFAENIYHMDHGKVVKGSKGASL